MSSSEPAAPLSFFAERKSCLEAWAEPERRAELVALYTEGRVSFIPNLLPELACALPAKEALALLRGRFGAALDGALSAESTDPEQPAPRQASPWRSPVAEATSGAWIRRANMVGVNLRTVGGFFGVVKYALTLPAAQDAVHLLPFWEPGVVESLYGICSWEINEAFFDPDLAAALPQLDSAARQLKAAVNLLHLMGKTVGLDVIPHTDRYSEMALCYPEYFEWLRRDELAIVDHRAELHEEVKAQIFAFVREAGPAIAGEEPPTQLEAVYGEGVDERSRQRLLFGAPENKAGREARRIALVKVLHALGYEPVPATMAPPYRGLAVDEAPGACTSDDHGLLWRDYRITRPESMSRVFGPLARYKLYQRLDDNAEWAIDFEQPRQGVWDYLCEHYGAVQHSFGFDFMRGDMSHVQMRPAGPPPTVDGHYDPLMAIKGHIQRANDAPYFAYFAESFLAPPDVMAYGDELDHLELSAAEATLGDLQSLAIDDSRFAPQLRRYLDIGATRSVAPCLTMLTADKDDPRFDSFFLWANELRFFLGLFVGDLPSYMALGFTVRDQHLAPAPNEHYSKLYVFHQRSGPSATHGPYVWGQNTRLFAALGQLRVLADERVAHLRAHPTRWLLPPDPTGTNQLLAWSQQDAPRWVFVCNLGRVALGRADLEQAHAGTVLNPSVPRLPELGADQRLILEHCTPFAGTAQTIVPHDHRPIFNGQHHRLGCLMPGECRIYRVA